MKKIKNFFKFMSIGVFVLAIQVPICSILFQLIWKFEILKTKSYKALYTFWEKGGVFDSFKDYSLLICLILMPVVWYICTKKIYKYGFWRFILNPIIKLYRKFDAPKTLDIEHVAIKNLGKSKTLDEIIADKISDETKAKGGSFHAAKNIREQIALKIEENKKG